MAGYLKDLESLIGALQHGVVDPTQGWAQLEGLRDQQAEKKQARKAALAEMLSGVQQTGYETALEGGNLETLLANPQVAQAESRFGTDALMQMLSPYFNTKGTLAPEGARSPFPYAPNPNYGQSRLTQGSPSLSPTDEADITRYVADELSKGAGIDPTKLFQDLMTELPPEVAPQVSKLINDTATQLRTRF